MTPMTMTVNSQLGDFDASSYGTGVSAAKGSETTPIDEGGHRVASSTAATMISTEDFFGIDFVVSEVQATFVSALVRRAASTTFKTHFVAAFIRAPILGVVYPFSSASRSARQPPRAMDLLTLVAKVPITTI